MNNLDDRVAAQAQKELILKQAFADTVPLVYGQHRVIHYGPSYRNVTDMKNLPLFFSHEDADFPRGLYGTYVPLTDVVTIADHTRVDLEQRMITKIHEYMLHRNGKMPDGYALLAIQAAIADEREEPRYKR